MLAFDGFLVANGHNSGLARAAAAALSLLGENLPDSSAFTQFDFLIRLMQLFESKRYNGNWRGFMWLRPMIEALLEHVERKQ